MNAARPRHALLPPITMLVLASAAGLFLLAARFAISRHLRHFYLPWNLFLAWMPLLLALAVGFLERRVATRGMRWAVAVLAIAWLLFLPNAPYLLTDLVHLPDKQHRHYYADMMLILHFAFVGLMLGYLSLHVMHGIVEGRYGWWRGWCFVSVVTGLTGLGIYVGRFLRWNSWDVVVRPFDLLVDFLAWGIRVADRPSELILPALFASTTLLAYVLFASVLRPSLRASQSLQLCEPAANESGFRRFQLRADTQCSNFDRSQWFGP